MKWLMEDRENKKMILAVGDITTCGGGIVNAANSSLLGGGGVDGAIHRAAGRELLDECRTLNGCRTGEAKITKGYRLKADYVIHTVGPVYSQHENPAPLLENCYRNSLDLAYGNGIHELSFPAISTGVYGYPKDEAAKIAVNTVKEWLRRHEDYDILVRFVCFSVSDAMYYENVMGRSV